MGCVFRQADVDGVIRRRTYMLQFYDGTGKRCIESAKTTDWRKAQRLLKQREADIAAGKSVERMGVGRDAMTFDDGIEMVLTQLYNAGSTTLDGATRRARLHLRPVFAAVRGVSVDRIGQLRADVIRDADIQDYTARRLQAGAARGIVLELSMLRRMFNMGLDAGRLYHKPKIRLPKLDNARTGFFERDQFDALQRQLPDYWHGPAAVGYWTGWRMASEICRLEWRHVDFGTQLLTLDATMTKAKKGRAFPFADVPELAAALVAARGVRDALRQRGRVVSLVFHDDGEALVLPPDGSETGDLRGSVRGDWERACVAAGCPGRVPHDFRRTAVRNMVRRGLPQRLAMDLAGFKTAAVFQRYDIVDEADLAHGARLYGAAGR